MRTPGHVYVLEPSFQGHFLVYVRHIIEHARQRGIPVTLLTTPAAASSEEYTLHLGALDGSFCLVTLPTPGLDDLALLTAETNDPISLLPHADPHLIRLSLSGWRGRGDLRALVMSDPKAERGQGTQRRQLKMRVKEGAIRLANARRYVTLLHLVLPVPSESAGRSDLVPDPVFLGSSIAELQRRGGVIRQAFGGAPDTFWFGLVGVIGPWKNVDLVVESLICAAAALRQPIGLCLMGPIQPEYRDVVHEAVERARAHSIQVHIADNALTNREMTASLTSLDAVVMLYSTNAPNSSLAKAAALGIRVVGAGSPSIRGFMRQLGYGDSARLEPTSIAGLMVRATRTDRPQSRADLLGPADFAQAITGI